jgi:pSer/pThr/pTyr-binding forkhead associated (FHA) protein
MHTLETSVIAFSAADFWEACGASGPTEVEVQAPNMAADRKPIDLPVTLVGRMPGADLHLVDSHVSRRHAYLQFLHGRLYCIDLRSRTGCRFNGQLQPCGWLPSPGEVSLGLQSLRYPPERPLEADAVDWDPLSDDWPGEAPFSSVSLTFINAKSGPIKWTVRRAISLIGSSPDCKVRLWSSLISRVDSALVRTPKGVWIVDLLGRGRLRLRGEAIRFARLKDGDRLQIGDFTMDVREETPETLQPPLGIDSTTQADPALSAGTRLLPPTNPGYGSLAPTGAGLLVDRGNAPLSIAGDPLPAMFQHFHAMQQQMMEQFHQALGTMAEMFVSLHRDQMEFIQEELNRVHALTSELNSLKAQMAGNGREGTKRQVSATPLWPRQSTPLAPTSAEAADPTQNGTRSGETDAASALPIRGGSDSPAKGEEDIHAWLCNRMAALEGERQGRWQKILSFLTGRKTEKPAASS